MLFPTRRKFIKYFMIICILLHFLFQSSLPNTSINGLRRHEIRVEISLKGHNSSLSNTLVLLNLTHSFLPQPLLSGSPNFNRFYGIFASLVDFFNLNNDQSYSFDKNHSITILNLCKETGSVHANWLFCVESRPLSVLDDMALYALTIHWTYCRYKTVFLTIFESVVNVQNNRIFEIA